MAKRVVEEVFGKAIAAGVEKAVTLGVAPASVAAGVEKTA